MVRRDGARIRCFTRNGHDWADRFPAIVDAALRIKASSFLIDGEAVIARDDGTPDFHALRSKRGGQEAVLYAFDLIEHDGDDLRDLPLIERKRRLAKLIGRGKRRAIRFIEHLTGDGPTVFEHVCARGWRASSQSGSTRPIAPDRRCLNPNSSRSSGPRGIPG
jgi:ATP-dependent DNA ligase